MRRSTAMGPSAAKGSSDATVGRSAAVGSLSIWDALVLETALECGAERLYTGDARLLGQAARAELRAVDPFLA